MVVAGPVAVDLVHLRLDLFPLPVATHEGGVDFVVEVTDVAHHGTVFSALSMLASQTLKLPVAVTTRSMLPSSPVSMQASVPSLIPFLTKGDNHFEAVHAGLHGADRVDLGDTHDHAFLAQGLGRTLPTSP